MGRACSTQGAMRNVFKVLVGKPQKKRLLKRPRHIDGRILLNWILSR
jgi:hypothetical protein